GLVEHLLARHARIVTGSRARGKCEALLFTFAVAAVSAQGGKPAIEARLADRFAGRRRLHRDGDFDRRDVDLGDQPAPPVALAHDDAAAHGEAVFGDEQFDRRQRREDLEQAALLAPAQLRRARQVARNPERLGRLPVDRGGGELADRARFAHDLSEAREAARRIDADAAPEPAADRIVQRLVAFFDPRPPAVDPLDEGLFDVQRRAHQARVQIEPQKLHLDAGELRLGADLPAGFEQRLADVAGLPEDLPEAA